MRALPALFVFVPIVIASAGEPAAPAAKPADAPPAVCTLNIRSKLDMAMDQSGRITVPVKINGVAKRMMVDTGATRSLLTVATVKELHLPTGYAGNGQIMMGFGGSMSLFRAHIDELVFGKVKVTNFNLNIEPRNFDSAGLLGADFLSQFDVDLDFAKAKLNLIRAENCNGNVVYWTAKPYGTIPFEIDGNHIMVDVKLDGKVVRAALDTGSPDTVMSLDKASDAFDLDEDKLKKSRHYPFKTLTFGDLTIGNPAIALVTDRESGVFGNDTTELYMIIGMGVLRRLHMYIAYKDKVIYVTPATQY
jgi:clan AA aspartic protease (TIGR02281 family)